MGWKGIVRYSFGMCRSHYPRKANWGTMSTGKSPTQATSHHQPTHKRSVITSLMDRMKNLCDETNLASKLQIQFAVRANG